MTMVCDRCGEVFPLSNDVKYMTPFDDEGKVELMAVLSHNQIDEAIFSNPNENHIIKANYKCLLCWTKVEIIDERFATAVVNKGRNPIGGQTA